MCRSSRTTRRYYLAKDAASNALARRVRGHRARLTGAELVGRALPRARSTSCRPAQGVEHRVIAWDEVSADEGTGIVHIAPGCGKEDFALSKEHDLAVVAPIDEFGVYVDGFDWLTGQYVHDVADADRATTCESKGLLYRAEQYTPPLPGLLALRHRPGLPAGRRVVHRHGRPAPADDGRHPPDRTGSQRSAWSASSTGCATWTTG